MGRRQVAQPFAGDLPRGLEPATTTSMEPPAQQPNPPAAPATAEASEAKVVEPKLLPPVDWIRVALNGGLLLILVLELFAVGTVDLSVFRKIPGWLAGAIPILWMVIDMAMSLFRGERDAFIRRLSQSRGFTRALGISAAVIFLPAAFAFPELTSPRPVLLIVPAKGLLSRVTQADKKNGMGYLLSVREADGTLLPESDMTGRGSILLAKNPVVWLEGEQDLLKRVKGEELAAYLRLEKDGKSPITDKWTEAPYPVSANLPRKGKLKFELFAVLDGRKITSVAVRHETLCQSGTKLQVIFLEQPGVDPHEPICIR